MSYTHEEMKKFNDEGIICFCGLEAFYHSWAGEANSASYKDNFCFQFTPQVSDKQDEIKVNASSTGYTFDEMSAFHHNGIKCICGENAGYHDWSMTPNAAYTGVGKCPQFTPRTIDIQDQIQIDANITFNEIENIQRKEVKPLCGEIKLIPSKGEIEINEKGAKQSKVEYACHLIPPKAILEVSAVLREGANKYGEDNWRGLTKADNLNHAIGHIFRYLSGDRTENHLVNAACRMLFALETE